MHAHEVTFSHQEHSHPYWYAHVIKIFHVLACDNSSLDNIYQLFPVLWLRWYGHGEERI